MAAAVTLNSPTMEGQFYELIQLMQIKERNGDVSVANTNNITSNSSDDNGVITGNFTLAFTKTVNPDGSVAITIDEYLTPTVAT
ncbi:MAG: hypothetical protein AB4372_10120 [Xenococcus sp. (in: cyanobacteria)]